MSPFHSRYSRAMPATPSLKERLTVGGLLPFRMSVGNKIFAMMRLQGMIG